MDKLFRTCSDRNPVSAFAWTITALVIVLSVGLAPVQANESPIPRRMPTVLAQLRAPGISGEDVDSRLRPLRARRDVLRAELDTLLAQQAQLEQRTKELQKELELPQVPAEYQKKRCQLLDLLDKAKKLQQKIRNVRQQLVQTQRDISEARRPEPPPPSPRPMDRLDQRLAQPVDPISTMPTEFRRRLIGEDADKISGAGISVQFEPSVKTLHLDSGGMGGTATIRFKFSMSDGTRQLVRLQTFVESWSGSPAPGLIVTRGPTLMNKGTGADSEVMWGPIPFSWPAGSSGTGRGVLDVPSDSSILPEIVKVDYR